MIKRVYDILSNLGIPVFRIYSGMQQKQRIKHLNTFQKQPNAMLLATDVAARGLDLPNIETVINYHLPPTPTIFVHRSGRTARGGSRGLSLSLVSAQEKGLYHTIATAVGQKSGFPGFPLGLSVQPQIKQSCVEDQGGGEPGEEERPRGGVAEEDGERGGPERGGGRRGEGGDADERGEEEDSRGAKEEV